MSSEEQVTEWIPAGNCPGCGRPMPVDTPGGRRPSCLCPSCLEARSESAGPTGRPAWAFVPLLPEDLDPMIAGIETESMLGQGGMGAVYKGRQTALDRPVAVKVLPPELKELDLSFATRFHREAIAMARLNHPNIVTVYDFGETDSGHFYFVMEFVEGGDLAGMAHGSLAAVEILSIAGRVADALEYAHGEGVVHRDIKPANLLMSTSGEVKITDFGIAKLAGSPALTSMLTIPGTGIGTLGFAAPEQLEEGFPPVDGRADLYALAKVIYCLVAGQMPEADSPPLSELADGDPRWDAFYERGAARDPGSRYQTGAEMHEALVEMERKRPLRTRLLLNAVAILAGALGAWLFSGTGTATKIDHAIGDHLFAKRHAVPVSSELGLVTISNQCLEKFGRWPWDRSRHVELFQSVEAGSGATLAFDILFAGDGEGDEALAGAVAAAGDPVIASSFLDLRASGDTAGVWEARGALLPVDALIETGVALGHTSAEPDPDGILRRVPMLVRSEDKVYPSLGLALAMRLLEVEPEQMSIASGMLSLKTRDWRTIEIPLDREGRMIVNYPPDLNAFPAVNFSDLLGLGGGAVIGGGGLIVGMWAEGMSDNHATPVEPLTPGMFVHAAIANSVLTGEFLCDVPIEWQIIVVVLVLVAMFVVLCYRRLWVVALVGVGLLAGLILLANLAFSAGWLLRPSPAAAAVLVAMLVGIGIKPLGLRPGKRW